MSGRSVICDSCQLNTSTGQWSLTGNKLCTLWKKCHTRVGHTHIKHGRHREDISSRVSGQKISRSHSLSHRFASNKSWNNKHLVQACWEHWGRMGRPKQCVWTARRAKCETLIINMFSFHMFLWVLFILTVHLSTPLRPKTAPFSVFNSLFNECLTSAASEQSTSALPLLSRALTCHKKKSLESKKFQYFVLAFSFVPKGVSNLQLFKNYHL